MPSTTTTTPRKPIGAPFVHASKLVPGDSDYISISDLAKHWSVSRDTIYRAIKTGKLRAVRFPGVTAHGYLRIKRHSAISYLIRHQLADPEEAYRDIARIVRQWPLYMQLNLKSAIETGTL